MPATPPSRPAQALDRLLVVAIAACGCLAVADLTSWYVVPLGGAFRPLTMLLLAMHAWRRPSLDEDRRRWVLAALGISVPAECLLAFPTTLVPALCVFSLAQACYLRAMIGRRLALAPLGPVHLVHATAVAWALSLWSVKPAFHFVSVALFMVLLGLVSTQADTWWWRVRGTAEAAVARRAALGGFLWMLADLMWTFALLVAWIPEAPAIAVTLYLCAQWSLASMIGWRRGAELLAVVPGCAATGRP